MKRLQASALFLAASWLLTVSALQAGTEITDPSVTPDVAPSTDQPISQELSVDSSYTGRSTMKQGSATLGGVSSINSDVNYVVSPQIKDGFLLRFGFDWERNSFGLFQGAPLPNTLQSTSAIIGADWAVSDKIIIRAELHPGIYSDFVDVTGNDFDMPLQMGGTYLYSKDLQLIFGIQVDLKSSIPIIGIPGVRWQFADDWVLSLIPPKPQLQYSINNSLTAYVGSEILGGTYHVNNDFGTNHGDQKTNDAIMEYAEVRVGAGITWKFIPTMSLDISGGYVPYRNFTEHPSQIGFDIDDQTFHNNIKDGAPYAEVGIKGAF